MKRRQILAGAALGAGLLAAPHARAFPERQLRIVVPNAAGGGTDINARLIARSLEKATRQSVPVFNVVGGGTSIGARQVRDGGSDGHSILFIHQALIAAAAMGVADFPPTDLDVLGQSGEESYTLMVGKDSPLRTLGDAIAAARRAPDTQRFGVQIGALNHFNALRLANRTGVRLRYVNTGGGGPTRNALLGNHLDLAFATVGEVASFVASGDIRLLAIFSGARAAALPQVPTAREQGFEIEIGLKYWWWLPRGVAEARRRFWSEGIAAAFADEELQARFKALEVTPRLDFTPAAAADVAAQHAEMQRLAAEFGLR